MAEDISLKISIIGSGRLGLTLAHAIAKENNPGVSIVSVSSRSDKSLNNAKEILQKSRENILFTKNNLIAANVSNCIFICTPDDEIEKVCQEIFEAGNPGNTGHFGNSFTCSCKTTSSSNFKIFSPETMSVIHFSGSKKIDILNSAKKAGASIACMHPLKSFASALKSAKSLENTLYGVTYEKNDIKIQKIISILSAILKGRTLFVENDKKTLYHASACIASNYLVSLIDFAIETGMEIGLNPEIFLGGIIKLSEGTLGNVKKLGTKRALTGPIARGDLSTIKEHVKVIKSLNKEDIKKAYEIMGEKAAKIALENTWINDKTYNELIKILKS